MSTDAKPVILAVMLGLGIIAFSASIAFAGWFPETRLTNAPHASYLCGNNAHCLVTGSDGDLHLVWYDYRDGEAELYYMRFNGFDWTPEVTLTSSDYSSESPALAAGEAGTLHLVWSRYAAGGGRIHYKHFNGTAWEAAEAISDFALASERPSVTVDDTGLVHVVWREYSGGSWHVYHKAYDGEVWSGIEEVSDPEGYPRYPSVAAGVDGEVHVVWDDYRHGNWEIHYRFYDGAAWEAEERLTLDGAVSQSPSIVVDTYGEVHVFWNDDRDGSATIYHKMNDGMGWSADEPVVVPDESAVEPYAVAGDSGRIYIVWYDDAGGAQEVYYQEYDGSSWLGNERMSFNNDVSAHPAVAVGGDGVVHVVWHDHRDGNYEIYWRSRRDVPKPEIDSIDPDSASAYQDVHIENLAGTGFLPGAEIRLEKTGEPSINATNVVVESSTRITCDFALNAKGYWDVVIENPDGQADTLAAGFYVVPLPIPEVISMTPSGGRADESIYVSELFGSNFLCITEVRLQRVGESDIHAEDAVVLSAERLTCRLGLTGAATGTWDVVVVNQGGGADTLFSGFEVLESLWGDDVRLTNYLGYSSTSKPNARCIALDSAGEPHIVWYDNVDGDNEIYYMNRVGGTWGLDRRLSTSSGKAEYPAIAVDSGDHIHVVWADDRNGIWDIYYRNHDGTGWQPETRLTDGTEASGFPSISVDGNDHLHVVWQDLGGSTRIRYTTYDGSAWTPVQCIEPDISASGGPAVAVDGYNHVHVVWYRDFLTDDHIYYKKFDGYVWSETVDLVAATSAHSPTITIDSRNRVCVAWHDGRYGGYGYEVFCRRFDGLVWEPEVRITDASDYSHNATLAADDAGNVYLMWADKRSGVNKIYYARHDGEGWGGDVLLAEAAVEARLPSVASTPEGVIHLIWRDERDGNAEIYYKSRAADPLAGAESEITEKRGAAFRIMPNPVRTGAEIRFHLIEEANARLAIYDVSGRLVFKKALGELQAGSHRVSWNMTDLSGNRIAPGVYLATITARQKTRSAKIVVLR